MAYIRTAESREKQRQAMLGKRPWNRGRPWPADIRSKISAALIGRVAPNKGKPMSDEQKQMLRDRPVSVETRTKLSAAQTGKRASLETKQKLSKAHIGRIGTMKGRHHSPDSKQKMSLQRMGNKHMVGKTIPEEVRRKISDSMRIRALEHSAKELPNCKCAFHTTPYSSKLEETMVRLILGEFPVVERQRWFGRFRVDAYLPSPYHLAFEADGEYWHRDRKESDARRDRILLERFGLPVIRMSEREILACSRKP